MTGKEFPNTGDGSEAAAPSPTPTVSPGAGDGAILASFPGDAEKQSAIGVTEAPEHREVVLYSAVIFLLTAVSLWPLWTTRLLPMQDYPQHLFLAHVTATYDQLSFNWKEFYRVHLGFRPYMLWYLAVKVLSDFFDTEVIGRILFSLYILLITALALVARRLSPRGYLPWGALLLYPFAFNQMYYMGFSNYIISLPILFLALLDLDNFAAGLSPGKVIRHAIYLVLLFLNHPYSVLVYIALAATSALFSGANRRQSLRMLIPPAVMSLIFLLWFLLAHTGSSVPTAEPWQVWWWPLEGPVAYYFIQFTGMKWAGGPDWTAVGLWSLVAILFTVASRRVEEDDPLRRRLVALYFITMLGFIMLPFWMGYYSYFNLRLAPVSYFALSLLLCRVPMRSRSGLILACTVLGLLWGSIETQKSVAREAETVLPVLSAARGNALILPLIYKGGSGVIDPGFFHQMHDHEPDYYHLLVGGGANPSLFHNAMMPVQYRPGLHLPFPERPTLFSWAEHGAYYDYVMVREAPAALYDYLAPTCNLIARSGPWDLFQNKTSRKPL